MAVVFPLGSLVARLTSCGDEHHCRGYGPRAG